MSRRGRRRGRGAPGGPPRGPAGSGGRPPPARGATASTAQAGARELAAAVPAEVRQAERSARRLGSWLAIAFLALGLVLGVLAAGGRGWPYWLGAVDFLVVGAVLLWAARDGGTRAVDRRSASEGF